MNGLAALYEVSFNSDGVLKNDSVLTAAVKDRQITQPKLDWVANFYAVAVGTDIYSVTINPTAGFTYGDGVTTSFLGLVKFTNGNTGPATLNVNAGGAKPIKKPSGSALAAGDLIAGSIHILAFDGTVFQLLTALPTPSAVPHFITPITVFLAPFGVGTGPVAWATFDCSAYVPTTAVAVILQADYAQNEPSVADNSFIYVRKNPSGQAYVAGSNRASGTGDETGGSQQGMYPFDVTGGVCSFQYEITVGFNFYCVIRLIGYIA